MELTQMLHPKVRRAYTELLTTSGIMQQLALSALDIRADDWTRCRVTLASLGAYWLVPNTLLGFQYLSEEGVEYIRKMTAVLDYTPNGDESAPYQMPEAVLAQQAPELATKLVALHKLVLDHVWVLAFGMLPRKHNSVQIAKYREGHPGSGWHYDEDSECTTTVGLSSSYVGGGMRVFGSDVVWTSKPGEAFLFKGATTLHRSNPVTVGERNLLVHWVDRE